VKNVRLLLEKGSDVTTKVVQNGNMTVFHQAVANDDIETLTLLLEHVLSITDPSKVFDASGLKNDSNVTVLKAAVDKLKIQSILLLLAHSCSLVGAKSAVELLQDYGAFAALPDWLKNKPWNYYFYSPSHGGSIIPNGAASPDPSKFPKDYSLSQNVRAVAVDNTFTKPQYVDGLTDAERELAKMIWNHSESSNQVELQKLCKGIPKERLPVLLQGCKKYYMLRRASALDAAVIKHNPSTMMELLKWKVPYEADEYDEKKDNIFHWMCKDSYQCSMSLLEDTVYLFLTDYRARYTGSDRFYMVPYYH